MLSAMRRRSARSRPEPLTGLEQTLAEAAEATDEPKLTRALARSDLFVAQLPERPLPIAEGRDGTPILLAFTSLPALLRWHPDDPENQPWSQLAAGELFAALPANMSVFINPADDVNVVLSPAVVHDVAELYAGREVPAAFLAGPSTAQQIGAPADEPVELLAAAERAAGRHPELLAVHRGLTTLDEPDARIWPVLGLRVPDGLDAAAYEVILADVRQEIDAVTTEHVEIRRLGTVGSGVDAWLLESDPVYAATPQPGLTAEPNG
jgi:hypothetical protein